MIISTYNVKLPEDGDKGQPVFDSLINNFEILRDHSHNGTNSAAILATSLTKGSVSLASGSWTATTTGYKQTVTCPGNHTLANSIIRFQISSGANQGKIIHPTIVRLSATTFEAHVNDSSINVEVLFV